MNIYDTANRLAQEIKQSEEYMNYKMAKQALNLNKDLKEKMAEFEKMRYDVQIHMMQTGKQDEEKYKEMQNKETKFNIVIADVNKIIGEAIKDVMQ